MKADMTGKIALVTGAASGLGRGTALALARVGADVALVDLKPDGLEATAREVRTIGRRAFVHTADLCEPDACTGAVAATVETFGHLDALANVAGIIVFAHAAEMRVADWNRTLAVNLSAPFFLSQAAIPHLIAREDAIVNCASTASFLGEAYAVAYGASKAGLLNLTKGLAMEYVHQPIRINAVAPGGMATGIFENAAFPSDADFELVKRYSGLRGLVEVEDVADMIVHLASPAGRAFHGACISMDRGITAG